MMPLQLWETTMDPERRVLKQLNAGDAARENVVFSSLMGTRVMCITAMYSVEQFVYCKAV